MNQQHATTAMPAAPTAPTIGVIIPVHNAAAYLGACLAALRAQTFADFACVLVDDGSTDGSCALCDDAAAQDARFTVLHQAQSGVCAARTAGLAAARAKGVQWFAFCDADDCCHVDFLRALRNAATATGLPLACCRYDTFTDTPAPDCPAPDTPTVLAAPAHLLALLHDHAVDYGLWNKLYAASLLTEEMIDNGLAYNEDLLANWAAFGAAPGCAFVDFAGYHYRQHADSASHRKLAVRSITDQKQVAAAIREQAAAMPWPQLKQSADAFYYEKLTYLASMILRRADAVNYTEHLAALRAELAAGAKDPALGRSPLLPKSIRLAAFATLHTPRLWQLACRHLLKDRQ